MTRPCVVRSILTASLLAALLAVGGCYVPLLDTVLEPQATFEITSWDQPYYEYLGYYGIVEVFYRVTNTGPVDIDYYQVWLEVTCADGSQFQEWTNGLDVPAGGYMTDSTYIDTAEKEVASVRITHYELTSY